MLINKNIDLDSILGYIKNTEKKIVIFGLSEITKQNIDHFRNIYAIVDNNKNIQKTKFKNIDIFSPDILQESNDFLVIFWGNHIENTLQQAGKNEYVICGNRTESLMKLNKEYLSAQQDGKKTFKNNILLIDIELHSYCNRSCWFCPNSFIDRKRNNRHFDKDIFTSLMIDLSSINYDNTISFNGYSEPMANKHLEDYLKIAKNHLPNAKLHINTNGDFINSKRVEELYESGLKSMWIQIYLEQNEKFSFQLIDSKLKKILSNSKDIDCKLIKNTFDRVEYICTYKDMEIKAYARDFSANGVNRGDLAVSTAIYTRDNPCSAIFNQVVINHKAEILPCCHIRTDYEKHKSFALGSLENNNIFDIFKDKQYLNWRKNLLSFDKRFEYPCTNCNYKIVKKTALLANHIDSLIK